MHPQGILSNSQVQAQVTAIYLGHYIPDTVVYPHWPLDVAERYYFPTLFIFGATQTTGVIKNHKILHLIFWEKVADVACLFQGPTCILQCIVHLPKLL